MGVTGLGLEGKAVIVTGAAQGIGRAFAMAFAAEGARVLAADIACCKDTCALVEAAGGTCVTTALDVTDAASCRAMAQAAQDAFGAVDVLVNNAAFFAALKRAPFMELDEDDWDKAMNVNTKGVWQVSRAVVPLMKAQGGSIINIASATVFSGSPHWMHYVASKGAVIAISRVMAKELGPDNMRVNVIAPGFTLTEASFGHIEDARNYGVGRAALCRNAEAEDITGGALYLASKLSGFMTGQTLVIDDGKQFI
ncbi:SDR family NAD(P)-dependent oxidoreductase [Tropicibacter naphthalenivorans]|uniref:2-dehydro-3-deoxy-D-gluconate 5-dehydrogenase n=1 Tax=Tropicibacter naphthalenivorans TaxID=441103 RepID=A0A0P1GG95_9RHOB|nr:SDR family oxidoreductase [Tropicibacter naphthalenivorans]CUH80606.1 2-dehydro-3-deoxy-D-gluconate 5-dehydrogenase [Tropicibacter naphthalenivorans]SMC89018.1 NAD(P)-dependent dehydrogenase, short-chain alcohol dehydrogenase family [Tropicibacter naphthalenivorans]